LIAEQTKDAKEESAKSAAATVQAAAAGTATQAAIRAEQTTVAKEEAERGATATAVTLAQATLLRATEAAKQTEVATQARATSAAATSVSLTATAMPTATITPTPAPTSTPLPTPTPAPTSTPVPTPTVVPGTSHENPASFFETVTNGGVSVTLHSGYFDYAYGYSTPKGGYKYLIMNVTITCVGPDDRSYNPMYFSGEDADTGAGYDSALVLAADMLGSDTLSPGEYVTGTIVLEVQETATRVIVKYDPVQGFDTNDLYWILE
jgi:hypothetical protein